MKEKKIYTAADFARYHSGKMPANEMHALEKAALDDPFLDDALEGYATTSPVESDIEELRARLAERKKKKVFLISSFAQNKWWRIAALLIIMAGAGYLFYRINYNNVQNSLAKNEINTSPAQKDSAVVAKGDSIATNNDVAFENQEASKLSKREETELPAISPPIEKKVPAPLQVTSLPPPASYNRPKDENKTDGFSVTEVNKDKDAEDVTGYLLKGKDTGERGNAISSASVAGMAGDKAPLTDTTGRLLPRSKDSSTMARTSAAGYASKSFGLKKDSQPTVAGNKREAVLNEVVVTGVSKRKQLTEPSPESNAGNQKAGEVKITSGTPQPSGGREKFDQYVKENAAPIYDENNERLSGEVLLSFRLSKKGKPKNINVVRSSCKGCESEAIRLLQNGPVWIGKKDEPGTAEMKF